MRRRPSGWSAADGAHLRPAVRARARLGAPSARGTLPRGDVVRRVVVLPDTAGRHARAHVPGRAPQGMAVRDDHHGRLGGRRRGGVPHRPVRVRAHRAVAAGVALLAGLPGSAGLVRSLRCARGVRRGLLADPVQDLHDRGWCRPAHVPRVPARVRDRARRALLPGGGADRAGRRAHGDDAAEIRGAHRLGRRGGGGGRGRVGRAVRRMKRDRVAHGRATLAIALLVAGALCLAACGSSPRPERSRDYHIVRSGETLFTIAWRYGKDWRELARWNDLGDGSLIFPGQLIKLYPPPGGAQAAATTPARRETAPAAT